MPEDSVYVCCAAALQGDKGTASAEAAAARESAATAGMPPCDRVASTFCCTALQRTSMQAVNLFVCLDLIV